MDRLGDDSGAGMRSKLDRSDDMAGLDVSYIYKPYFFFYRKIPLSFMHKFCLNLLQ